jgi:hypothetical protein
VQVRLYGQTAEVNCAWKMLEHHALPMPGGELQPPERFSSN